MFNVYFQYGPDVDERDFLYGCSTIEAAETYRAEQLAIEGWAAIDAAAAQYVIIKSL